MTISQSADSSASVYIQPLTLVPSPQAAGGDAVRLAGGMVFAREFALIVRQEGRVVQRDLLTPSAMAAAIERLPAPLAREAAAQWSGLQRAHSPLQFGQRALRLDEPQVMGILNVTPDSFSDGGRYLGDPAATRAHAAQMLEAGATILDIGGESTRPGAAPVWERDEIARVVPAVEAAAAMDAIVSIDTRRAAVMAAALDAGGHIVNDVAALRDDPAAPGLVAARGCPVVLMHAPAGGDNLHARPDYNDVLLDVFDWLRRARDEALAAGIAREMIILDPGIGFGKSMAENLALMNGLALFHALGQPLLLGASRKRLIGALSNEAIADRRLGGSLTLALAGMAAGVQILRVHDVFETVQARDVWRGLRDAALADLAGFPG